MNVESGVNYILIIDDEMELSKSLEVLLRILGHHVLIANSGQEGINAFNLYKSQIVTVILDYYMPKMNGKEVLRELRSQGNKHPVYISSGYLTEEDENELNAIGVTNFLHKPYDITRLNSLIDC